MDEPERFTALVRTRFRAMGLGAIVLAGAVGLTAWNILGLLLASA